MGWMHHARRALGALPPMALVILLAGSLPARAQGIGGLIPVGRGPFHVGVNPATNRVYASNSDGTVSVIDGATDMVIATIPVGPAAPGDVAVNPTTNRIYAAIYQASAVAVIDGARNAVIATVPVGQGLFNVAVNPATNRVYATTTDSLWVIDGATNTVVATVPVEQGSGVAANPVTNRIYVSAGGAVVVIDGASHTIIGSIPVGGNGGGVDVNPATDRVYVALGGDLAVIDGATRSLVASIPLSAYGTAVALNPATNRVYVRTAPLFPIPDILVVFDATSNTVLDTLAVGMDRSTHADVAVNPVTNRVYVPQAALNAVWVTEDPLHIGITGFGISPRPEGVLLSWTGGTLEAGYLIARWGAASGTVTLDLLPRGGPLPAGTTTYTDREALTEAAYLYAVLPLDGSRGVLSVSDLLGLQPNMQAGAGAPQEFTLRYVRHAPVLTMTWREPGGQTYYALAAMDSRAIQLQLVGGDQTGTFASAQVPTCFIVFAVVGVSPMGNTHSLCAAPLASMMEGP